MSPFIADLPKIAITGEAFVEARRSVTAFTYQQASNRGVIPALALIILILRSNRTRLANVLRVQLWMAIRSLSGAIKAMEGQLANPHTGP